MASGPASAIIFTASATLLGWRYLNFGSLNMLYSLLSVRTNAIIRRCYRSLSAHQCRLGLDGLACPALFRRGNDDCLGHLDVREDGRPVTAFLPLRLSLIHISEPTRL